MSSTQLDRPPIEVIYSGMLQHKFGLARELVPVETDGTVGQLLLAIAARHGSALHEAMFVNGALVPNAIVLLDGRDIRHKGGSDTLVGQARRLELLVLPPATGGG